MPQPRIPATLLLAACLASLFLSACTQYLRPGEGQEGEWLIDGKVATYQTNPRYLGAKGDGKHLDTDAINRAIAIIHDAGGGTVRLSAGTYLCTSIHLQSNVTLYLDQGAILEAAPETIAPYDAPEPNAFTAYQDFGHSHWHNSLIWGEDLTNVAIEGPGLIRGTGLHSGRQGNNYDIPIPPNGANKALALRNCRNVILRDFSILHGGHFAILATGVDNFTVDNVKLDTDRDGIDIDACRNVRVSNMSVNSPWDDGICLKSSYGLGLARACENVTITNCFVTGGLVEGTLLDGTFKTSTAEYSPKRFGRIKLGTESNGGFRNITISNCTFDDSMGLAIESMDGGIVDNIAVSNLVMRNVSNAPLFVRLGSRLRGPNNPPIGSIRGITVNNLLVIGSNPKYASIIAGLPGHAIADVRLSNIQMTMDGGGTKTQAALTPPEVEAAYPDPDMFGELPGWGFFIRHAAGVEMNDVEIRTTQPDERPAFYLNDVQGIDLQHIKWPAAPGGSFRMKDVTHFSTHQSTSPDTRLERVEQQSL